MFAIANMALAITSYVSAAAAGVASHIAYFNKGEHHLYVTLYIKLFLAAVATGAASLHYLQPQPWTQALPTTSQLAGTYLIGLYSSLLIYRVFLHPLCRFPGPLGARISTVWLSTQLNHNLWHKLQEYHNRYGLFVRTGSSDLSISHPKAVEAIYSASSPCTKAAWYDFTHPGIALQNMRDPAEHAARRKVWALAFSDKLLRGYEQRVRIYRQLLVEQLTGMRGQPVNATKWTNLYSFDVMGTLTFNESFGSLERGEDHWAIRLLNDTMGNIGLFVPIWLFLGLMSIPGLSNGWWRFLDFCGQKLLYRLKNKPDIPDVSSVLISHLKGTEPTPTEQMLLDGDARLIVVAGSDTTACTLACVFYELVRHPEEVEKLRAELTPYLDETEPNGEFLHSKIAGLNHLNGVISEALRLYPPVPGALQRKTPPEGIMIDDVFIPGNMTVSCPQYVIGRSPLCYERPDEFIPERWYKYPEMIKDKTVFAPFTLGPYNCIGKPLAMLNLRTTVARMVMEFDMRLAPGEDGKKFLGEAQDNFVLYMGELRLVFEPRK
ncbi:cytochrome P450 [Aspergillus ambiguus]|uniref:cytochrome P450 n=1 Tax=Aspergillus ambiguus TaxID=176160 RepID=UPI003CCE2F21